MATPRAMRLFTADIDDPNLQAMLQEIRGSTTDQIKNVLEFARKDVLYFLKGYTDKLKPPRYQRKFQYVNSVRMKVPKSDRTGWRPVHPGGWADVSDDLRKKYYTDLRFVSGAWQMYVGNRSDHAVHVEARDGYFVVRGVMEPNGPVSKAIRRAIVALGIKGWKIVGVSGSAENLDATGLRIGPRRGLAPDPSEEGEA